VRAVVVVALLSSLASCAPSSAPSTVAFANPRALTDCANVPADLQARLWISGSDEPCFLDVDVDAGTTSGDCTTAPGIERRFTVDWFVDVGGREVLLAQAQKDLDLSRQAERDVTLAGADDDVVTDGCQDMSVDSFEGSDTVDVDGEDVPVCDLDGDGSANIVEVCAGDDPLGGP
jgi:hypothetical protein